MSAAPRRCWRSCRWRALASSLPETHPLLRAGVPHRRCDAGQSWDWDGVRFELLHPLAGDYAPRPSPTR